MYTAKSVSQRSAIFNPEEIRVDHVLFSLGVEFHAHHSRFAFSVRRFPLWRVCEKLHFRTRFQGIRLDGYKLVKKNRSESRTFHRAPQTAP